MTYNIVLKDNKDFVLVNSKSLLMAKKRLKEIKKTDKWLANYYGWKKLPKYEIIESEN